MSTISTEPQDMPRKPRAQVLAEIRQLEQAQNSSNLYGYLINLAKYGDRPQQYEKLFSKYLTAPEAGLREAAVFSLLFTLRLQNAKYRAQALAMVADEALDFDARMWAGSGLAVAYRGTQDPGILGAFLEVIDDARSDKYLKSSYLRGIVLLMGISSREQWLRAQSDSVAALQAEFAEELAAARLLARPR
jgi:hypothetical protein